MIQVYQIYFKDEHIDKLEPGFIPYDNKGREFPFNFEYAVFFDLYKKIDWEKVHLLGTTSWKFNQKTGLTSDDFLKAIADNPGYDVYFVNPFPEFVVYKSVWEHGEEYHPNLKKITYALFSQCGINPNYLDCLTPPNLTAYCNYWVANKKFWDEYIKFLQPIWHLLQLEDPSKMAALSPIADRFINAPYAPFIFERLFSTFLSLKSFKAFQISGNSFGNSKLKLVKILNNMIQDASKKSSQKNIAYHQYFLIIILIKVFKFRYYVLPYYIRLIRK